MAAQATAPEVSLTAERFFGDMVGHLAGSLEDIIGVEEASGFLTTVGTTIGDDLSRHYKVRHHGESAHDVARICVDLKTRIGGAFEVESVEGDRIVLIGHRCPFAGREVGRPSLCMVTTNVFGRIAAQASGYANVKIDEALAAGDGRCRVIISLAPVNDDEGHDFFA